MSGEQVVKVDGVTLKGQQLECYNKILEALGKKEQFHWCVLGLAGTGKTTLSKAIQNAPHKCLATAYIKTAAELIGADIINSIFLLEKGRKADNRNPGAIDRMNEKLRAVDVLLIDNINFVGDVTFSLIDRRLREARRSAEPFGGISVICFGDLYQQKRVDQLNIYEDDSKSLGLWRLFELFELTENYKFQSEEERIVLKTIATLSEKMPALTVEQSDLMKEAKRYLEIHCGMDAQEDYGQFVEIAKSTETDRNIQGEVIKCNYLNSQGLSFDRVIVDRSTSYTGIAEPLYGGQFYSGISRAKSLNNCRITPMDDLTWRVQAGANEEMERLRTDKDKTRLRAANNQPVNP
ncbi:hypothetical protein CAEBREN_24931 [Caenorhabditis brenneri]|uniref:ATP-dependent DNA helicase n=1 Tax=Caenorhabditis brenneri TaxID=135651 RepID=G0N2U4_CAEBE|nr:hypothetical protein CAEBREN_24931 [Caenorhabditis brenneri]